MNKKYNKCWQQLFIFLFLFIGAHNFSLANVNQDSFKLQNGDLLFQDLNCGEFCDSIDDVTYGVKHTFMSHVAMVVDANAEVPMVIEAVPQGVILSPLQQFLYRSLDEQGHPRVVAGRLKTNDQHLINTAIMEAEKLLGFPYNYTFIHDNKGYYCSELMYEAFQRANHDAPLFHMHPMSFNDSATGKILPSWQRYFERLHVQPPQGFPGINPGGLSREASVNIVHWYGHLRSAQMATVNAI